MGMLDLLLYQRAQQSAQMQGLPGNLHQTGGQQQPQGMMQQGGMPQMGGGGPQGPMAMPMGPERQQMSQQGGGYDPDVMRDAFGYALELKKMSPEEREQAWPKLAQDLIQREPKLQGMIDPSQTPGDKVLAVMTDKVLLDSKAQKEDMEPEEYNQSLQEIFNSTGSDMNDEEKQEEGNAKSMVDEFKAQQGKVPESTGELTADAGNVGTDAQIQGKQMMHLTKTQQTRMQDELIKTQKSLGNLKELYTNFKPELFKSKAAAKDWLGAKVERHGDWVGIKDIDENSKESIYQRKKYTNAVKQVMLQYRKLITGVAGGEKEMRDIENAVLNMRLSPTEAKAALDQLTVKYLRDSEVYKSLLQQGVSIDTVSKAKYSNEFLQARNRIEKDHKKYISRFKKANPKLKMKNVDILRYKYMRGE